MYGWLGLDFGMGGRDVWSYLKVCCGKERDRERRCLFVVVERVEELVVFPREGTEEKMFLLSVCFLIFLSASGVFLFLPCIFLQGGSGILCS